MTVQKQFSSGYEQWFRMVGNVIKQWPIVANSCLMMALQYLQHVKKKQPKHHSCGARAWVKPPQNGEPNSFTSGTAGIPLANRRQVAMGALGLLRQRLEDRPAARGLHHPLLVGFRVVA